MVSFKNSAQFSGDLMFFTDSLSIPSVDLDTQQIRRYGYGPVENVAFRPVFTPLQMTFIVESSQRNVLASALQSISGITSFMNYNTISSPNSLGYPYEVGYKKDYEFGISVYVYNESENVIMTYDFRQCYAKTLGSIGLGWGSNDQYMRADIQFQFTDYTINATDINQLDGVNSLSPLQNVLGNYGSQNFISALQNPQSVSDALNLANSRTLYGSTNPYGFGQQTGTYAPGVLF
jgi:hypothetical protein